MPQALRVASFGECMLELQGQPFGTLRQGFGGDTLNTAVYLARCGRAAGLQVAYATALGDDTLSDGLLLRWQAEGLDTSLVRRLPGRLPGLYLIETDERGERQFRYWRGEAAVRSHFDAPAGTTPLEREAHTLQALYFSGISLAVLPPAGRERLLGLAAALRQRGAAVVFDNNYRPRLWADVGEARQAFAAAMALASLALVTLDDEVALWHGHGQGQGQGPTDDDEAPLRRALALPPPELVVKRGAAPTLVRSADGQVTPVPTVPVPRVVDTTAAGDSFAGAYLAARLAGATPVQAAAAGNRLAACVVQHRGAIIEPALMAAAMAG